MSKHTSHGAAATSERELTADDLEHVSGGKPSAAPKEAISFNYSHIEWAYTPQKD